MWTPSWIPPTAAPNSSPASPAPAAGIRGPSSGGPSPPFDERLELIDGNRAAEQVPLEGMTPDAGQEIPLCDGLHPLGDDAQAETLGQRHDGAGDGGIVGVAQHILDEGLVDLQQIEWHALQVGQGGRARSEIIQ